MASPTEVQRYILGVFIYVCRLSVLSPTQHRKQPQRSQSVSVSKEKCGAVCPRTTFSQPRTSLPPPPAGRSLPVLLFSFSRFSLCAIVTGVQSNRIESTRIERKRAKTIHRPSVGHVLVFSFIQRFFPNFFPSTYTDRRQNLLKMYTEVEKKVR